MGGRRSTYHESTQTIYEPDKVRIAEIEAQKAVAIKKLEGENIKLRKEATIEMMETNARFEQLIINAKVEGFKEVSNQLLEMAHEYNLLAEQRIKILEIASGNIVKTMNENYIEFKRQIDKDSTNFMNNDLSDMLAQADKFEKDSASYNIYHEQIKSFSSNFIQNQTDFIKQIHKQQDLMIQSHEDLKKNITEHTNKIVENRIKYLEIVTDNQVERLTNLENNSIKQVGNDTKLISK